MKIPLVDLSRQLPEVRDEIETRWSKILDSSSFILGDEVAEFERQFAAFCQSRHCVGVGNGTDALELILRAAGVGSGDEVIVPANTFIATALAVLRTGAAVKLIDCDPTTYLLDLDELDSRLGPRTKAVIPVHLFGQMAPIEHVTDSFPDLIVVEDAAQAHGATRGGRSMGSFGVAAATSFYPGKNLGAFGDAGAVVTDDDDLAGRIRTLRNWGSDRKYHHPEAGFNSRLDTIQAVVLSAKLHHLEAWNEQRREAAARYDSMLGRDERVSTPVTVPLNEHVFHLYVVEVDERDRVLARLQEAGIEAGIHYPVPLHLQGALSSLANSIGDFPAAENAARRMISLPIFPGITALEQERVVAVLLKSLV
jgi:dTDP-4-amino-4,6-dideoxygalactose transaminase